MTINFRTAQTTGLKLCKIYENPFLNVYTFPGILAAQLSTYASQC